MQKDIFFRESSWKDWENQLYDTDQRPFISVWLNLSKILISSGEKTDEDLSQ